MLPMLKALLWITRTILSICTAAVLVPACLAPIIIVPFWVTIHLGNVMVHALGYQYDKPAIDQFAYKNRFEITALPTVSDQDFDSLFHLTHESGLFGKTDKNNKHICVQRIWSDVITICFLKKGSKHYAYVKPLPVSYPCVNVFEFFFFECLRENKAPFFSFRTERPAQTFDGWFYTPDYGLEQVVFDQKAQYADPDG